MYSGTETSIKTVTGSACRKPSFLVLPAGNERGNYDDSYGFKFMCAVATKIERMQNTPINKFPWSN